MLLIKQGIGNGKRGLRQNLTSTLKYRWLCDLPPKLAGTWHAKFQSGLHEGVDVFTYSVRTILSEPKFLECIITKFSYPWCSATNNTAIFVWPWKDCDREFWILHSGSTDSPCTMLSVLPAQGKPVLRWRNPHAWRHSRVISSNQRSVFTQPAATRLRVVSLFCQI